MVTGNGIKAVIVGNGAAAVECCKGLRDSGFDGTIEVFALGTLPVYNPMLTTYYAADKIGYSLLFPYGESNKIFEKYGAVLYSKTLIVQLSAKEHIVVTENGEVFNFDKCLIATGARPFVPPVPGMNLPGVLTMRTVEDAMKLRAALAQSPQKAVIIGASMIGIKLVELFWQAGIETVLVDMAERIFSLAAHPACSRVIEDRLRSRNVDLKFSSVVEQIVQSPDGLELWFKGESQSLRTDLVLMCTGVRANLDFVDRTEVEVQQGVLVNSYMESSVADVYGAGDVAQGTNLQNGKRQIIGLWANARRQGYIAGYNMAGGRREYSGEILHNITHFMDIDFIGLGDPTEMDLCDHVETLNENGRFAWLFYRNDQLCGANFLNLYGESGIFKSEIIKQALSRQSTGNAAFISWPDFLKRVFPGTAKGVYNLVSS
jgi:NAD(P)H-nitrite reductase large subunit